MKVIIHDLESQYAGLIASKCDRAIAADGKYAPCQGCFGCWTKHPAGCFMKDKLQQVCRIIGTADELVDPENSRMLAAALREAGVPCRYERFEGVGHGVGLARGTAAEPWFDYALDFWQQQGGAR